jgi:2-haloacid dehalogenase
VSGIKKIKSAGNNVVAFSNGAEAAVRTLLQNAQVLQHLDGVISVDDLKTFKPNPDVYEYLAKRMKREKQDTWLVSSNPWDVIGAKSAGLRAAWVKRKKEAVYDPWGIDPDCVVADLNELADWFAKH